MKTLKYQRATLYLPDGRIFQVKPQDGKQFTLKELQTAVQGYIENVEPLNKRTKLWVNEDGIWYNLPPNPHTHEVVSPAYSTSPMYGPSWRVRGNMLSVYRLTPEEISKKEWKLISEALRKEEPSEEHSQQNTEPS